MINEIIITYLHFLGFISIFVAIVVEKILFKRELSKKESKQIRMFDALYGVASIVMLSSGFAKMYWFGKGMDYYMHNHIFWTKILLFSIVGFLSIYPTITFMKWKKLEKTERSVQIEEKQFRLISKMITFELIIMIFIPLCAHFMARGFGYVSP